MLFDGIGRHTPLSVLIGYFYQELKTFAFLSLRFSELLPNRFRWFGKLVKADMEKCGWVNGVVKKWQSRYSLPLRKLAGFEKQKSTKARETALEVKGTGRAKDPEAGVKLE